MFFISVMFLQIADKKHLKMVSTSESVLIPLQVFTNNTADHSKDLLCVYTKQLPPQRILSH